MVWFVQPSCIVCCVKDKKTPIQKINDIINLSYPYP